VLRPNAEEFGKFARAVGTRYSGSYTLPSTGGTTTPVPLLGTAAQAGGQTLPRVGLWSIWNEPNLPRFLLPQRRSDRAHTPESPAIYRGLLRAAHEGLSATGHGGDTILMGELLPVGRSGSNTRSAVRPLEFLRELACVDRRLRSYRGSAASSRGCTGFTPLPGNGLAYHPYTQSGGPTIRPNHPDDATIGTLSRVRVLSDRLGDRRRLATKRLPLWLTEFGFQTNPPDELAGTPIGRVPGYMGESEFLALRERRVASYSQYPLVDDKLKGTGLARFGGFQSGLRFEDGRAKPGVYDAYRRPIFARLSSSRSAEVFGGVREAASGEVVVEAKLGRGSYRRLGSVKLNSRGYFRRRFSVSRPDRRTYRFRFGSDRSRAVRAVRR